VRACLAVPAAKIQNAVLREKAKAELEGQTEGCFEDPTPGCMPEVGKVSGKAKMLGNQGAALAV
jgi:hypothetical protein